MKYKKGDKILYKLDTELIGNLDYQKIIPKIGFGTVIDSYTGIYIVSVKILNNKHFYDEYQILFSEVICKLKNEKLSKILYEI